MLINGSDARGEVALHSAPQPAAEQRIDDQVGVRIQGASPRSADAARSDKVGISSRSITTECLWVNERADAYREARFSSQSCDDVTVAGIVASTADDLPTGRAGKPGTGSLDRGRARARHEGVPGDTLALDRKAIQFAHRGNRVDFDRQHAHG